MIMLKTANLQPRLRHMESGADIEPRLPHPPRYCQIRGVGVKKQPDLIIKYGGIGEI